MLKTNPSSVLGSAALAAWLAVFAGAGVAQATVIDPQLFVGPPGTNSPPGGTAIGGRGVPSNGHPYRNLQGDYSTCSANIPGDAAWQANSTIIYLSFVTLTSFD